MAEVCDIYFARALDKRFQDGYIPGAAGAAGVRKEKNGLLYDYITPETGVDSVHRRRPLPLTPNSELQTLANHGPWILRMSRRARASSQFRLESYPQEM